MMHEASGPALPLRRSMLFVPGSRPDRFEKALASGADAVCLDLEDGVAPDARPAAREAVRAFLEGRWSGRSGEARDGKAARPGEATGSAGGARPEVVVRINHPAGEDGRRDLEMLRQSPPDAVMVPKVEGPAVLGRVAAALAWDGGPALLPLVETPAGLRRVEELAEGFPVAALVFGGMDLAAGLGADFAWEPLLYARSRVVHAAALAGIGAVDAPWAPLDDAEGLEAEARRAAGLGFTGKLAIHPAQVAPIHRGMAPGREEVERARRVVDADAASGGGVVVVDGRMVDRPVVLAAHRVLARAGAAGEARIEGGGPGTEPER